MREKYVHLGLGLACLVVFASFAWIAEIRHEKMSSIREKAPFLAITNRDFALFLWDNPLFMKCHSKSKSTYLPGFSEDDNIHIKPGLEDCIVVAPAEVLYAYHLWREFAFGGACPKPEPDLFAQFLADCPEWQNHPNAAWAFSGWRHFYLDRDALNGPVWAKDVAELLAEQPGFERKNWQQTIPGYLKTFYCGTNGANAPLPAEEVPAFLRAALARRVRCKSDQTAMPTVWEQGRVLNGV